MNCCGVLEGYLGLKYTWGGFNPWGWWYKKEGHILKCFWVSKICKEILLVGTLGCSKIGGTPPPPPPPPPPAAQWREDHLIYNSQDLIEKPSPTELWAALPRNPTCRIAWEIITGEFMIIQNCCKVLDQICNTVSVKLSLEGCHRWWKEIEGFSAPPSRFWRDSPIFDNFW